jgi:hypothetical protein
MTNRGRSRTRVGGGWIGAALLALVPATVTLAGCPDENECERCALVIRWDSDGNFIEMTKHCEALDCGVARCGSCYDLEYNSDGLPLNGTCDTCSTETDQCADEHPNPGPGEEWMYCVNAEPHCVDVYSDHENCGECDIACATNQVCTDGQCL